MAKELSTRLGVPIMEASAKTGENVELCFIEVTKSIYEQSYSKTSTAASNGGLVGSGQQSDSANNAGSSVRLSQSAGTSTKKKCC
jgi:hypothetical protein